MAQGLGLGFEIQIKCVLSECDSRMLDNLRREVLQRKVYLRTMKQAPRGSHLGFDKLSLRCVPGVSFLP